jgi:hypothetical protein
MRKDRMSRQTLSTHQTCSRSPLPSGICEASMSNSKFDHSTSFIASNDEILEQAVKTMM